MMVPYVCLQILDQGPAEDSPYAREAYPWVVRDLQGELQNYGTEPSWAMCPHAPWWRERLAETCVELYRRESSGGFYLDTMHGTGEWCYWTPHGHSAGGGSAGPDGMHGLAGHVRDAAKAVDPELVTSGEDSAENMIDVIDGRLYQHTLAPTSTAPLFAAVYNDYISRYGMQPNPDFGEGFYMGAASLFVEGAQIGRLPVDPYNDGIRFDDDPTHTEQREYLGRFVGYYRQEIAREFIVYGQLMRPLTFAQPSPMPMMTADVAPWSLPQAKTQLPALLSGVFRAEDGELGFFIVNCSGAEVSFLADVALSRHGIDAAAGTITEITPEGVAQPAGTFADSTLHLERTMPARGVVLYRVEPE